jgi:acetylornithine deacetylase/succinyl-diaminopimelate desuccinylase-like protein
MPSESQLQLYFEYLRFPTISADAESGPAMTSCADWLKSTFTGMGFDAKVCRTAGRPAVIARRYSPNPNASTLLIYGHYDVQPVDPIQLWNSPPFEPVVKGGLVCARGATDNKGQTIAHILGTKSWIDTVGELPINLIYLIEGEEEIGSPNLVDFLREHSAELACDGILISDTSMVAPDQPAITRGLRGIACVELFVRGPAVDLHSGIFGGAVRNPGTELARLVSAMHDSSGHIAIPGFYDAVAPVDSTETSAWKQLPYSDADVLRATGSPSLCGEAGFSTLERLWSRPTAEVNGITAGYQGLGSKTIVPKEASAKLSFRLVPFQEPADIASKVAAFFSEIAHSGVSVKVRYDHGGEPFLSDPNSPLARAARLSLTTVFGREPALIREGMSIPIVSHLKQVLGREPLLVGLGLPDCAAHSPNETFPLASLEKGITFHLALLRHLA